jgi:hypothetical protein
MSQTADSQLDSLIGQTVRAHIGIEEWKGRKRNVIRYYLEPVPDFLAELLLGSWEDWLTDNPCPSDEPGAPCINLWIPKATSACLFRKLPPNWSADLIRRAMTRPEKSPREVERTVERIYGGKVSCAVSTVERVEVEPFDPYRMCENAAKVDIEITPDWLAEQSPECVLDVRPSDYLDSVFNPGERVAVKISEKDTGLVYTVGNAKDAVRLNRYVTLNEAGAWYYTNPVDGQRNPTTSCYSDARITDFRHLLLESDKEGFEQEWLKIVVQLPHVVALYTSGNISVHALIRVHGATDKESFDRIASQYRRAMVPLGACEGSLTATRATRLPGVVRRDNGNVQRLLYLNPRASVREIYRCPEKKKPSDQ